MERKGISVYKKKREVSCDLLINCERTLPNQQDEEKNFKELKKIRQNGN
jgi:hypothetical protein